MLLKKNRKFYANSKLLYLIHFSNRRKKISGKDFQPVKVIGKGALGEVMLCKEKSTNITYAIKKIKKCFFKNKIGQVKHILSEREMLKIAKSQRIVSLKYSFQV